MFVLVCFSSPSAPYSPDRAPATPTNTPILQTQTSVITTQPQTIPQNLLFLDTGSPTKDSCDESNTTQNTVQDTSSILNRPPLPPVPTTRTVHIPEPNSVLQYITPCPHKIPTATKTQRKTPLPTLPKNPTLPSTSQTPITTIPEHTTKSPIKKLPELPINSPSELMFIHIFSIISKIRTTTCTINNYFFFNRLIFQR